VKQVYVKTNGLVIQLHGYGPVRTPVRFNIKDKYLDSVLQQLKNQGFQYEVVPFDENVITIGDTKPKEKKPAESGIDMKWLSKMIGKIVSEAISSDPTIKNINEKIEKLIRQGKISISQELESDEKMGKKKKRIEKEEEFIPSIKVDDMTIQSKGSFRVEQTDTNLKEAADQLKKVTK
jgi:hypothetical protein